MAKRGNPTLAHCDMPKMDPDEEKLSDMHSALHTLGDKIRKPYVSSGEKLLPKHLKTHASPESKHARKHIQTLHKAMKHEK